MKASNKKNHVINKVSETDINSCLNKKQNTNFLRNKKKIKREKDFYKIIGKNLKLLRKKNNVATHVISDLVGVSVQQMMKYENGTNKISIPSIFVIAEYYNISISWIFMEEIIL